MDGSGDDAREVKRIRFKLADKRSALVDLGKHLGMFVERKHVTHEHADKSDAELRAELSQLIEAIRDAGIAGFDPGRADSVGGDTAPGKPH
jgi:phage terminase small subunit